MMTTLLLRHHLPDYKIKDSEKKAAFNPARTRQSLARRLIAAASKAANPNPSPFTSQTVAPDAGAAANKGLLRAVLMSGALGAGVGTSAAGLHYLTRNKEDEQEKVAAPAPGTKIPYFSIPHLMGRAATSTAEHPLLLPGILGAGGAGALGASALTAYLLHKRMKAQKDKELAEALKAYSSQDASDNSKLGMAMEKLSNTAGPMLGLMLASGLGVGALSAAGAYQWAKGRSQEELLNKALKHRAYLESLKSPSPVNVEVPAAVKKDQEDIVKA